MVIEEKRAASAMATERLATSRQREALVADLAQASERVLARLRAEAEALAKLVPGPGAATGDSPSLPKERLLETLVHIWVTSIYGEQS